VERGRYGRAEKELCSSKNPLEKALVSELFSVKTTVNSSPLATATGNNDRLVGHSTGAESSTHMVTTG